MMIFLIILAVLIFILTCVSAYFFSVAIVRKKTSDYTASPAWAPFAERIKEGRKWFDATPYERVEIQSYDGLALRGRFYANGDSKKTLLLMHGYHSRGVNDFGCVGEFYFGLGFNLLVPDQRAHGESEGKYITYGVCERYDCLYWINYLNSRIGTDSDVFLDGISMGAATVLMAAGLDLPSNVRGIIADCGFTSPYEIFKHVLRRDYHLPPFPIIHITGLFSRPVAGFGFKQYSTLEAMKTNKIPIIFVHGEDDDFVPPWMSKAAYDACTADKYITIVPGAKHGMSYLVDTEGSEKKLIDFFEKYSTK